MMIFNRLKNKIFLLLKKSEKWTHTDMVYLAKGGFWLSLSKIISSAAALLSSIAFANLLSKETLGIYQYILSIAGLLSVFTLPQMSNALIRSIAKGYDGDLMLALKEKLKWGLLGSVVSLGIGLYYYINHNLTLAISFLIVAIFLPLVDPITVYTDYLQGKKLFKETTIYRTIIRITTLVMMVSTLFLTNNIFIILLIFYISRFTPTLILFIINYKKFVFNTNHGPDTLKYGKHLTLMNLLQSIVGSLDKIFVFHYLGAAQLAIYYYAIVPEGQIKSVIMNVDTLAFPKFSTHSKEEIKNTLPGKILKMELFVILPIIIGYIIIAPFAFNFLFPQYLDSIFYSQIYILSIIFILPKSLFSSALEAIGSTKQLYFLKTFAAISRLIILIASVKLFGLMGIILGGLISAIVNYLSHHLIFKKN